MLDLTGSRALLDRWGQLYLTGTGQLHWTGTGLAEVRKIMAEAEHIEVKTAGKRTENQHRQLALLAKKLKLLIQAQLYAETGSVETLMQVLGELEKTD